MATKKEKEELIEILKFTPRTYTIQLGAYGGEVYFGRVDRKIYDFFKKHKIDLDEYASGWDEELWDFIPDEMRPFPPGSPYECDNLCHASGPSLDSGNYVTVYDENNNEVWQCELDTGSLENEGVETNCWEEEYIEQQPEGTVIFWGGQGEKGLCYGGDIELKQPFDPKKLKINYSDADGWCIVNGVEYDGEDVENNDYSTTGKWGENKWIIVDSDEEIYEGVSREDMESEENSEESEEWDPAAELEKIEVPVLENEEMWAQEAIDGNCDNLARSDWFPVDVKPNYKGEYEVELELAAWPFPSIVRAEWTGRTWKQDGKKVKIKQWRGLAEEVV